MGYPIGHNTPEFQHPKKPGTIGVKLFEKAFDFYAGYLSYYLTSAKQHSIFEFLILLMQLGKLSFEQSPLLSAEEETTLVKELHELHEGLIHGILHHQALIRSVEKMMRHLTDTNTKARLVAILMRLEHKIDHETQGHPELNASFKKILEETFKKISPAMPDLIASTLCRELDSLLQQQKLPPELLLQELQTTLSLLKRFA